MRTPATANFTHLHLFRHYEPWRGLFKGHIGHTNSEKIKKQQTKKAHFFQFLARSNVQEFVMEKQLVVLMS